MKAATILLLSLACFICLFSNPAESAPAPNEHEEKNLSFWDKIFNGSNYELVVTNLLTFGFTNIPRSVLKSTGEHINKNGVKCKEGESAIEGPDGKGTCHDTGGLNIARSAIDSVNDFLNG